MSILVKPHILLTYLIITISCLYASQDQDSLVPWKTEQDFKNSETELLRKIDWLANNPFGETRKDTARFVVLWAINVPYITVITNTDYLGDLIKKDKNYKYSPIISAMQLFGSLAYLLEHPGTDKNDYMVIKAGIQSMIDIYNKINLEGNDTKRIGTIEKYKKLIKDDSIDDFIRQTEAKSIKNKKQE